MNFGRVWRRREARAQRRYKVSLQQDGGVKVYDPVARFGFEVEARQASELLQICLDNVPVRMLFIRLSIVEAKGGEPTHTLRLHNQELSFGAEEFELFADTYVKAFTSVKRRSHKLPGEDATGNP